MKLKKLMEEKGKLVSEVRRLADLINDEARDFTSEENAAWEQVNKDLNTKNTQIDATLKAEEGERSIAGGAEDELRNHGISFEEGGDEPKEENRDLAINGWTRGVKGTVSKEERAAAAQFGYDLTSPSIELELRSKAPRTREEARAMSAVKGSTGAFTVQPVFVSNLEVALLEFGGMRSVSDIIRTDTGAEMSWPTFDDTSNEGHFVGENVDHGDATDPDFEQRKWNAYECSSGVLKVPEAALQDSALPLDSLIPEALGTRIARRLNRAYTAGTGAAGPMGVVPASTLGKTAAAAAAVTLDEVLDLIYSVDRAYRTGASHMFADATMLKIRKLKDGEGQYQWQASTSAGEPDRLWNYPITINEDMPAMTSGLISMVFGQLKKYKIRDVRGLVVKRLVERYAEYNQVGFLAIMRTDGNLLDAGTNPVKHLIQA